MLLHLLDLRGQSDGRAGWGQAGGLGCHAFLLLSLEQRQKYDGDTRQLRTEKAPRPNEERRRDRVSHPASPHLVEEVDGGKDGEHGHGQGHILGEEVRSQLPPLPIPTLPLSLHLSSLPASS